MQLASIVSERFGFKIPQAYVRMAEAGLLALARSGVKSPSADASKTKKLYTRERALAACDLQWLSTEEIAARIQRSYSNASSDDPSVLSGGRRSFFRSSRWPADFVYVPFAENRAGDEWGWAPSLGEPGAVEPPIMFLTQDAAEGRIAAPTFATFLFRMTLESLAHCPHDKSEMALSERIAMLRGSTRAVLDFLPAELSARLDRVLELPIRKVTVRALREKDGKFYRASETTHLSLVAADWAARIVREELEDPRVDQPLRIDV